MNPKKVRREDVINLTDLPNIGKAMETDLKLIGITRPDQLLGRSPYKMYQELCDRTGVAHDPCVIDVFLSITSFIAGGDPKPWWDFTEQRKCALQGNKFKLNAHI